MKKKWLSIFMLATFLAVTAIAPLIGPIGAAQAADTSSFVDEYAVIYPYLNDTEKAAMTGVKAAVASLTDWDEVIAPLLTTQFIAKFDDENEAKAALIAFAKGMGKIYYSSNVTELTSAAKEFKTNNADNFAKIFGADITIDDLYALLTTTKDRLPAAVSSADAAIKDKLAFGSNTDLVGTPTEQGAVATVTIAAMKKALVDPNLSKFSGKLGDIAWTPELLVKQQRILGQAVDSTYAAELAIAKAGVRSQTELYKMEGATETLIAKDADQQIAFKLDSQEEYRLRIMGMETSTRLEWVSSEPGIASVSYTVPAGYPQLTPVADVYGTAVVTAYRYSETGYQGTPENDWVMEFTVTVGDAQLYTISGNAKLSAKDTGLEGLIKIYLDGEEKGSVDANGDYSIAGVTAGTYLFEIKTPGYAKAIVAALVVDANLTIPPVTLLAGEVIIDANNSINIVDYNAVVNAYGSDSTKTNWNAAADLDKNGIVNISDYNILVTNYGESSIITINMD